jgi:hypothetical protein
VHNNVIDTIFASQLGIITWAQARSAGLTARQVELRRLTGEWLHVHHGVYRLASAPRTYDQRLLAGVLAAGDGSAVSHRAAIARWGLHGFGARLVEVSRPAALRRPVDSAIVHRMPDLNSSHVEIVRGIPTTMPARTLVDAGMVMPAAFVARCMEAWLADRVVTIAALQRAIADHAGKGRKGVGVLRRVLEERVLGTSVADSGTEAMLAEVLAAHGVPLPTHHHLVGYNGVIIAELDYAYVPEQIAIEIDGYGVHLRSRDAFEADRYRQNDLEVLGWHVLRFTRGMIVRTPGIVAGTVARMHARRQSSTFHVI